MNKLLLSHLIWLQRPNWMIRLKFLYQVDFFFLKRSDSYEVLFASIVNKTLPTIVSTLKGEYLLPEEKICSFKRQPCLRIEAKMKMAELLTLKGVPFT